MCFKVFIRSKINAWQLNRTDCRIFIKKVKSFYTILICGNGDFIFFVLQNLFFFSVLCSCKVISREETVLKFVSLAVSAELPCIK